MPEAVLNAYNILDAQRKQSVMDYINFLVSNMGQEKAEATHSKQEKINHRYEAFLDLAGKVDIDANAVQHLREISTL